MAITGQHCNSVYLKITLLQQLVAVPTGNWLLNKFNCNELSLTSTLTVYRALSCIIEDCKEEMSVACTKVNTINVYLTTSIHLDQLAGIQASYLLPQPLQTLKQFNCKVEPLNHHCHVSPGAN